MVNAAMNFVKFLVIITTFCSGLSKVNSSKNGSNSYSFVLACGATSNATDADGRIWSPDSTHLPSSSSSGNSITSKAKYQDPSLVSDIPYMTARIFKTQTTYSFPVSPISRHWIRLHFYPSSYDNFNCSNSFFSVTVGGFTLLNNFSASITAQALTQAYIIREFTLVPLQTNTLNITFNPSSVYKDSFAFINGIEIISMPEIFQAAPMVGFSDQTMETEASSMQTMFRLNVGGQYIPANNDSGLGRIWYDDAPYLFGASFGVTSAANNSVKISYPPNLPNYIAPVDVYRTARSMGPNPDVNRNYNLTWIFQIDGNFTYLVRLHFCEFQLTRMNQRVFNIYINNQTALEEADVISWTSAQGVPAYKDFVIYATDQPGGDEMWVALHPNDKTKAEFYDSILNGLEIFKINDTTGNLAGPNPVPSSTPPPETDSQPKPSFASNKSSKSGIIAGSVVGLAAGFGIVFGVVAFIKRKKNMNSGGKSSRGGWLPIYSSSRTTETRTTISGKSSGSSHISNIGGGLCRHFTLAEIKHGTKNFDESLVIGVGGFGKVYKGEIDGGTSVAIKRANPSSEQGLHEFQTEIELLSKLRHRHLVSLIGACEENEEMILVYDYMANGTLREHLYKHNKPPLSWKQRLDICIGAARGLHYLHTGARYTIIHRDVKTTNILLDDKWVAKVSDFGLSKTGPNLHQTHVSTMVKGSFGYLDPEYFRRQQLTEKSDVYSFGVVLYEVLCGRPALNPSLPKEQVSLADWALHCHRRHTTKEIVDPHIKGEITQECLKQFVDTAVSCLSDHGTDRPSMGSVLWNLEYCLQMQNNPDGPKMVAEQKANDAYAMHTELLSITEEGGEGEESEEHSTEAVFSQIVNPQGR
ncbi:PREDICTED: receptor-like protein kinase ANXUR1 [Nicotiana attenuata]|uniref:non-specific serine/threonine protein kinase n=1 Tax=Nicotiana attenuata TaxID=49451 RepID=A0A1J6KRI7_NICAT|nr:PREDICTED: receptor-like protein kinase ANXUR1 [Nicotiana attenuata]OIT25403.1 receptor-like protein kinase anxur1 [Nicotiana attenuata]